MPSLPPPRRSPAARCPAPSCVSGTRDYEDLRRRLDALGAPTTLPPAPVPGSLRRRAGGLRPRGRAGGRFGAGARREPACRRCSFPIRMRPLTTRRPMPATGAGRGRAGDRGCRARRARLRREVEALLAARSDSRRWHAPRERHQARRGGSDRGRGAASGRRPEGGVSVVARARGRRRPPRGATGFLVGTRGAAGGVLLVRGIPDVGPARSRGPASGILIAVSGERPSTGPASGPAGSGPGPVRPRPEPGPPASVAQGGHGAAHVGLGPSDLGRCAAIAASPTAIGRAR